MTGWRSKGTTTPIRTSWRSHAFRSFATMPGQRAKVSPSLRPAAGVSVTHGSPSLPPQSLSLVHLPRTLRAPGPGLRRRSRRRSRVSGDDRKLVVQGGAHNAVHGRFDLDRVSAGGPPAGREVAGCQSPLGQEVGMFAGRFEMKDLCVTRGLSELLATSRGPTLRCVLSSSVKSGTFDRGSDERSALVSRRRT